MVVIEDSPPVKDAGSDPISDEKISRVEEALKGREEEIRREIDENHRFLHCLIEDLTYIYQDLYLFCELQKEILLLLFPCIDVYNSRWLFDSH